MALTADVVIIGGGVTGDEHRLSPDRCAAMRDVIVVDKSSVASGGTGKSSACVRQHYSTAETCRMIRYSLDFFQRFEELTGGGSCGFRRTGYLLGVDERMRAPMEASVALQRSVGIDTRLVSPAEMREIEPRLRTEDLVAGCYEPDSGYCNPVETAQGFARAARERGARVLEDTEVLGRSHARATASPACGPAAGDIHAPRVVNAAGLWGARDRRDGGPRDPDHAYAATRSASSPGRRRPGGRTRWSTTSSPTSTRGPSWASTSSWAGLDAEESHDLADPDALQGGREPRRVHRGPRAREPSLPRARGGPHRPRLRRLLRRHARLAPDPGPRRPRGLATWPWASRATASSSRRRWAT